MNGETLGQGLRSSGSTVVCLLCGQAWPITHLEDHSPSCMVPELQRLRLHVQATKRVIEAARAWRAAGALGHPALVDRLAAAVDDLDAAPEPK